MVKKSLKKCELISLHHNHDLFTYQKRCPAVVADFKETGVSFYATLAMVLDICVSGMDLGRFTNT